MPISASVYHNRTRVGIFIDFISFHIISKCPCSFLDMMCAYF